MQSISTIHWYNRCKATEDNILKYDKVMGTETIIIDGSFVFTAVIEMLT